MTIYDTPLTKYFSIFPWPNATFKWTAKENILLDDSRKTSYWTYNGLQRYFLYHVFCNPMISTSILLDPDDLTVWLINLENEKWNQLSQDLQILVFTEIFPIIAALPLLHSVPIHLIIQCWWTRFITEILLEWCLTSSV